MATVVQNAAKGRRGALTALYEANKKKVWLLSSVLLPDSAQAGTVTVAAFKEAFALLPEAGLTTGEDFSRLVVSKAAGLCRSAVLKRNPKALRLPAGKNFLIPAGSADPCPDPDTLLSRLPALQRWVFLLHTVGDLTDVRIGQVLQLDTRTVQSILDAEGENLRRVAGESASALTAALQAREAAVTLPAQTETQLTALIDSIATPAENAEKKRRKTTLLVSVLVVCLAAALCIGLALETGVLSSSGTGENETVTMDYLDENLIYYADIEIEDYGTVTVQLDQSQAPITCANFVYLAKTGFYDGLTFHRIKEGFVMQGGDPNGDGTGGSTAKIAGEFSANGYDNTLSHTRGAVSMARSSDSYDSASSQFFIVHQDSTALDGEYAVFGYVTEGMDIVDEICQAAEPINSMDLIAEDEQPVITTITIRTESSQAE